MATDAAPETRAAVVAPAASGHRLSGELHALAERFREQTVTLREVIEVLGARAAELLMVILALPFCAPISIPGLSVPFGLVIATLAVCVMAGRPPWLPRRLLTLRLPPRFFRLVLEGASRLLGWMERRLKPRAPWLTASNALVRLHAIALVLAALLLSLPLGGIPFTNTLPALVIVVGTLGLLERDGAAIAASYALLAGTLVYFGLFAGAVIQLFHRALHWFS